MKKRKKLYKIIACSVFIMLIATCALYNVGYSEVKYGVSEEKVDVLKIRGHNNNEIAVNMQKSLNESIYNWADDLSDLLDFDIELNYIRSEKKYEDRDVIVMTNIYESSPSRNTYHYYDCVLNKKNGDRMLLDDVVILSENFIELIRASNRKLAVYDDNEILNIIDGANMTEREWILNKKTTIYQKPNAWINNEKQLVINIPWYIFESGAGYEQVILNYSDWKEYKAY